MPVAARALQRRAVERHRAAQRVDRDAERRRGAGDVRRRTVRVEIFVGGDRAAPSQVSARPLRVEHGAERRPSRRRSRPGCAPTASSVLHLAPVSVVAVPLASTTAQNGHRRAARSLRMQAVRGVVVDIGPIGIAPRAVAKTVATYRSRSTATQDVVERAGDRRRAEVRSHSAAAAASASASQPSNRTWTTRVRRHRSDADEQRDRGRVVAGHRTSARAPRSPPRVRHRALPLRSGAAQNDRATSTRGRPRDVHRSAHRRSSRPW